MVTRLKKTMEERDARVRKQKEKREIIERERKERVEEEGFFSGNLLFSII